MQPVVCYIWYTMYIKEQSTQQLTKNKSDIIESTFASIFAVNPPSKQLGE
jgi:hypothetical protein